MLVIHPAALRAARERAGLSREYVAVERGKSHATIEAYEGGRVIPPGNELVALAALYGVAVEELCREQAPAGAA
jgi:transcriptional regulator with XRE-family HTH domain